MKEFTFEHTYKFNEDEYAELFKITWPMSWPIRPTIKKIIMIAVCISLFFSKYTIGIGILLLVIIIFYFRLPKSSMWVNKKNFREIRYLQYKITYGINEKQYWIKSKLFEATATWKNLKIYKERLGWLLLISDGIPTVCLPIKKLKKNNIYDDVTKLCKKHGEKDNHTDE